ncbi:hypothetical protein, partial [Acetobacter lambici]
CLKHDGTLCRRRIEAVVLLSIMPTAGCEYGLGVGQPTLALVANVGRNRWTKIRFCTLPEEFCQSFSIIRRINSIRSKAVCRLALSQKEADGSFRIVSSVP